jgi:hypothetical protein
VTRFTPRQTRILGGALVAYGLHGLLVIAGALAIGAPAIGRVEGMIASAVSTMSAASRVATTAADSFDGLGSSMEQARSSATDAASLSREAAATSADLANAMSVSIFGAQPLISLADDFSAMSGQLQGLAVDLDGISAALTGSDDDLARVGRRLRSLAADLSDLRDRVEARTDEPLIPLSLLFYGFLLWQALLVVASLAVGVILLR